MSDDEIQAIDAVVNLHTTEVVNEYRPAWSTEFLSGKLGQSPGIAEGLPLEDLVKKLDAAHIERAMLLAVKCGPIGHPANYHLPYEVVAKAVDDYPDRFLGIAGIDPTEGMDGVRALEKAVTEMGFVGAHLYPHWFEMAPDHAKYYPFYAKCVELGIPIQMQVGHCLRYSRARPLRSVGRPITLDTIACDFPELRLIGIHVGWPWTEEMISVAYKHPNVYIGSDAYAPKHWDEKFVHYLNTFGRDKVIFGTDFPVIDFERARREIKSLGLRTDSLRRFLYENATAVYNL